MSQVIKFVGGMAVVQLRSGRSFVIDQDDAWILDDFPTVFMTKMGYVYLRRIRNKKIENFLLHRLVMCAGDGMKVDHINGNPSDNRRSNLRVCTHLQNMANQKKRQGSRSKFKGVTATGNRKNPWQACIKINYEKIYLGVFPTEEAAAFAYDRAATKHCGEFARTNFGERQ